MPPKEVITVQGHGFSLVWKDSPLVAEARRVGMLNHSSQMLGDYYLFDNRLLSECVTLPPAPEIDTKWDALLDAWLAGKSLKAYCS